MPIIGKLIKKTTAIAYKRNFNKGKEYVNQLKTLEQLLEKAEWTAFGQAHHFSSIRVSEDEVKAYQQNVPITDYEKFYQEWLRLTIAGEKDHTWAGKIKHYALSSGTTGSPSKRIPVTDEMIRSFQKTGLKQISILHELDLPESFFASSMLAVGGCTKLTRKKTHIEGDLSGILKKYTSFVVTPFAKPGNRIAGIKDWNTKLEKMVEKAPDWNIGIIMGVPSWCIMLMEKVVERYKLNNIHEVWPNLEVYVHGGVFMKPYISRLEKVLGRPLHLLDTYLASEGYFAYQQSIHDEGMRLLLNSGVFYEFVPFNSDHFDDEGNLKDIHTAYTLSEVMEGVDYALVISTNAGLWRYMIGDLVRFINVAEREIKISGRIKQFLSLAGEHLSLDNINTAIDKVSGDLSCTISEFCIVADQEKMYQQWYFGTLDKVNPEELMKAVDKELSRINDDYASVRKYTLKDPVGSVLSAQTFYDFMDEIGKAGSQNKFPRVMNPQQAEKWSLFLSRRSL
jgi:phenylacetate-coenzyme A ligase PaaK-like adenylate-forming protein